MQLSRWLILKLTQIFFLGLVQKIVDLKRNKVNGSVKLKLYKGNITIISRKTNSGAYSMKKVSFEENKTFNKSNVEKFINFHKKKLNTN